MTMDNNINDYKETTTNDTINAISQKPNEKKAKKHLVDNIAATTTEDTTPDENKANKMMLEYLKTHNRSLDVVN
jgi:hypothetical protein